MCRHPNISNASRYCAVIQYCYLDVCAVTLILLLYVQSPQHTQCINILWRHPSTITQMYVQYCNPNVYMCSHPKTVSVTQMYVQSPQYCNPVYKQSPQYC